MFDTRALINRPTTSPGEDPSAQVITLSDPIAPPHPRSIGWLGTTALAMGGSNQSLFLIGALVLSQGSAAIPLLILGLLLSLAAAPGWTELILMWPNRVGGIAATCSEAFRPYSPVLANLTGVCYWWGWVPTCGLTAILSATAINEWYMPFVPVPVLAVTLVLLFTAVNLCGVRWVTRCAIPVATISASLALLSALIPLLTGHVAWHRATTFHLLVPFHGVFGQLTSAMAGLYLIGFAAPAFEAAACHVGETIDPERNVPRAMIASACMAVIYFLVLPVIWLGALGAGPLAGNLERTLGPTFAPLLGDGARAAAIWFMMFNMFHGTLQPLAGAARTLMQIAEDGLVPRILARRSRTDAPWVATLLTAGMAIVFLLMGDPTWLIAAANLAYLIGIALPNVAVWLLRRDAPEMRRPFRAPRGTIRLGLIAAGMWGVATIFGFEQFGLPTVLTGVALCYSSAVLYALRRWSDGRAEGKELSSYIRSLHVRLTGAMLLVLSLDGAGYLLAASSVSPDHRGLVAALEDIFVAVALLTITVGLVLPGMIAHAMGEVARAADSLATGTLADFVRAMQALSEGNLEAAHARPAGMRVVVRTRDEVGAMAASFNTMQDEITRAVASLEGAREGLREARQEASDALLALEEANVLLRADIAERQRAEAALAHQALHDALTNLPNRRLLADRLQQAILLAQRQMSQVALLLLDLDGFKDVNDTFGHQYGDALLQQVGLRLRSVLRESDTIARLGGDEFAIVLPGTEETGAQSTAERVREVLKPSFTVEACTLGISASIGIALSPHHGGDVSTLLRQADVAMYAAKRTGQSHVLYVPQLDQYSSHKIALTSDLRHAIEHDQLLLHYQPMMSLRTGDAGWVEALVRWNHPERGLVPPDQFIGLAEETGLIEPLTIWVLETALAQCRRWHRMGLAIGIAVNLSARTLHNPLLVEAIGAMLRASDVDGSRVKLEITESTLMADPDRAMETLTPLTEMGITIAVDDFGTGYSSLAHLKRLPVAEVKIDRSFVVDMSVNDSDAVIVRSVIDLGRNLGLDVVAEGVEDRATWDLLAEMGCDRIQGYYLSRPVPAENLERWYIDGPARRATG